MKDILILVNNLLEILKRKTTHAENARVALKEREVKKISCREYNGQEFSYKEIFETTTITYK